VAASLVVAYVGMGKPGQQQAREQSRIGLLVAIVAVVGIGGVWAIQQLPDVRSPDGDILRWPRRESFVDDVVEDARALKWIMKQDRASVVGIMAGTYMFMQTFCVPGSTALNLLAGAVLPLPSALLFSVGCAAAGATTCFLLVKYTAAGLVMRAIPEQVKKVEKMMEDHKSNLFYYFLFLRISPLLPNWLLNIASPMTPVSTSIFFWGTALGVLPASLLGNLTGMEIMQVGSGAIDSTRTFGILMAIALLSLLPVAAKRLVQGEPSKPEGVKEARTGPMPSQGVQRLSKAERRRT